MSLKYKLWRLGFTKPNKCPYCASELIAEGFPKDFQQRYRCKNNDCQFNHDWIRKYKIDSYRLDNPTLSIIILNRNKRAFLQRCVESIRAQVTQPDQLIIVDNGSDDDSCQYINSLKNIIDFKFKSNVGFAAANNKGIDLATSQYVLILNNDTIFNEDVVRRIKETIDNDFYFYDLYALQLNLPNGDIDTKGIGRKKSGIFFDVKNNRHNIIGPCGGAAVYSKVMLEDIRDQNGYFDERYFIYCEDSDLSMRARRGHWHCSSIATDITHAHGETTKTMKKSANYLSIRNRIATYMKAPDRYFLRFLFMQGVVLAKYTFIHRQWVLPAMIEGFTGKFKDFEKIKNKYGESV